MFGPVLLSFALAATMPPALFTRPHAGGPQMVNGQSEAELGIGGAWRVVEVEGLPVPPGITIGMTFANGEVSGIAGCSGYKATTAIAGDQLGLGMISYASKECEDEVMAAGSAFVHALGLSGRFEIGADGRLTLFSASIPLLIAARP